MPHINRLLGGNAPLIIAVLYTTAVSVLFFIPSRGLALVSFSAADKILHGLIYFILVIVWLVYVYIRQDYHFKKNTVLILFLAAMLFGIIIEILQGLFTASRSADFYDVMANLTGSLLGILFFRSLRGRLKF